MKKKINKSLESRLFRRTSAFVRIGNVLYAVINDLHPNHLIVVSGYSNHKHKMKRTRFEPVTSDFKELLSKSSNLFRNTF